MSELEAKCKALETEIAALGMKVRDQDLNSIKLDLIRNEVLRELTEYRTRRRLLHHHH